MINLLRRSEKKPPEVKSVAEVIIEGTDHISYGSISITEVVSGDFYALNRVVVEAGGFVTGNIFSTEAEIKGRVAGDILCRGCVILRQTGVVSGRVIAESIEVDSGAVMNGSITLEERVPASMLLEKVKRAARKENEVEVEDHCVEPISPVHRSASHQETFSRATIPQGSARTAKVPDTEGWW